MDESNGISIKNLSLIRGNKELYRDFSINFEKNKTTALLAPSGSGKTSLLDAIAGLVPYNSGIIECQKNEKSLSISYLFQEPRLLPWTNVFNNCLLPIEKLFSMKEAKKRVNHFLTLCSLIDKKNIPPSHLSGGEKQRCALARTFIYPAPIMLIDEAFHSQDIVLKEQLYFLFKSMLQNEPRTVLLVTHDINEAILLADRIVVLQHKRNENYLNVYLDKNKNEISNKKIKEEFIKILSGG